MKSQTTTSNKYQKIIAPLKLKEPSYFLLFIDGSFISQLSTPHADLPSCLRNFTFFIDAVIGEVEKTSFRFVLPRNKILLHPLHLLFITTANLTAKNYEFRILIDTEANSEACIIEEHVNYTTKKCFSNVTTEIIAAKNSKINYTKLFHSLAARTTTSYTGNTKITQRQASNVTINYGIKNNFVVKENLQVILHEKATSKILGWCDTGKNQNITVATVIEHQGNQAVSEELFKYILRDNGKGAFTGNILVPEKVKQSTAKLYNKNLLLNRSAEMYTAPALEIYADDVAAHHGAATGQLDEAALFYLQTRGLKLKTAREILTHAFIAEVTEQFPALLQDKINW